MITKICIQCKKDFKVKPYRAKKQKFCDFDCYLKSVQVKKVIRCPVCNNVLFTRESRQRKYCSRECRRVGMIKKPMETKCIWCSKMVRRAMGQDNRKYCDYNCRREHQRHKIMQKYKKTCECCLETYYDTRGRNPNRRFCSKSCSATKNTDKIYLFKRN